MDKNGFSDPFVKFLMNGSELCKSDTKKKNLNPVWNQNFAVKPGLGKTRFFSTRYFWTDSIRKQILGLFSHEVVLEKLHLENFWLISEITICQKVLPSPAKDSCPKGKTSRWSLWSWCDRIEWFDWLYRVGSRSAPIGGNQSKHSEAPWIANQTRKRKTRNSTIYPTRCPFWRIRNWFTFGQSEMIYR